ncbi:MAG: tetratricopeptide repeat protein [Desulfobacula sp.]|nr:tetratricopeptide repeat protein [Desulfobacula sp.]
MDTFEDKIVFQPFVVPLVLKKQGYTGTMLIEEVSNRINYIRNQVKTSDQEKFIKIEAMEQGTEIQVPGTGMTLKEISDSIRVFLGTTVRYISGNLVLFEDQLFLTVRLTDGFNAKVKGNFNNLDSVINPAAEQILKNLDPFTLGKYYSIHKKNEAMQELVNYIKGNKPANEKLVIAHLIEGLRLFNKKNYEDALHEWNIATLKDPGNIIAFVYQGWALDELERFDEAIQKYRQVIKLDPDNPSAYNNLGISLYRTGKFEQAIEKFRKLIELVPEYPHAYNNLGYLLFELNKYEEGINYIKKAISIDPNEPGFYDSLGEGFFMLERYEEAIRQFRCVIRLDPENAGAYQMWGKALENLGRKDEASEKYAKAEELTSE